MGLFFCINITINPTIKKTSRSCCGRVAIIEKSGYKLVFNEESYILYRGANDRAVFLRQPSEVARVVRGRKKILLMSHDFLAIRKSVAELT